MSHSTVGVILQAGQSVEEALAPFDENISVDPYTRDCHCIGRAARNRAYSAANTRVGTLDSIRGEFWATRKQNNPYSAKDEPDAYWEFFDAYQERMDEEWKSFSRLKEYKETERDYLDYAPDKFTPDPLCETCGGTGKCTDTYNPKSRWDWYQIGGRWNGELPNGANEMPVSELLNTPYFPFAVLTPDGEWHEKGRMGWWGTVSNEVREETWRDTVLELYCKHVDCTLVLVDVHI